MNGESKKVEKKKEENLMLRTKPMYNYSRGIKTTVHVWSTLKSGLF